MKSTYGSVLIIFMLFIQLILVDSGWCISQENEDSSVLIISSEQKENKNNSAEKNETIDKFSSEILSDKLDLLLNNKNNNDWLYIIIALMTLTTALSIIISFWLYKWRRILLSQPNSLIPEEWGKYLNVVGSRLEILDKNINDNVSKIGVKTDNNTIKLSNLIETFMSLQNALDEKDNEIRRLKKGYDSEVFRKYLVRFIRINNFTEECIQSEDYSQERFEQFSRLFDDAFAECGVEKYVPNIGDDYRYTSGISDNPKIIKTDDIQKEFKIAEILESGYKLKSGNEYDYIVPAKVKVYKLN